MKKYHQTDAGVSEVIGFILIFAIMMGGIGLITLYGYPMLLQTKQNADINNMEKTFIVLQNDLKALTFKSVPTREVGVQVNGGVLSIVNDPDDPANIIYLGDELINPGYLKFTSDDSSVTLYLVNGAVIKQQGVGSVMVAEPRFFVDTDTSSIYIPITKLSSSENSVSGSHLLKFHLDSANIVDSTTATSSLQIGIPGDSPTLKAWDQYLVSLGASPPSPQNPKYTIETESFYKKEYPIQVNLS